VSKKYKFAVVGAGVSGAWTAYELSKYNVEVVLLEKGSDAAMGATKANSAIVHGGYDPKPGTLMAKLNVRGNKLIRELYQKMSIPFKMTGCLVIAFDDEGINSINTLYERGQTNGAEDLKLLSREETLELEPNLSEEVKGALYCGTCGIVSAFELAIAPADVAFNNGVDFIRNFEVKSVKESGNGVILTSASGETVETEYVINAAGVHADEIARLMGDFSLNMIPRKGEYSILDNSHGDLVSHVIFQPPVKYGKGILVSPTIDGNILIGPTAENIDDKEDKVTTTVGQKAAFDGAKKSVPTVNERWTITSFTGVRPIGDKGDFTIGFSADNPHLFNVAGIESPGLSSSPAIGEYVVGQLIESGIKLEKKNNFDNTRNVVRFKSLPDEIKNEIIKKNPLYGRVICRCETITEGEIVDAIHNGIGARDVDGVKRRVRAGMGRCQGGFCGPKVTEILARELNIPITEVTKFGGNSKMIIGGEMK